MPIDADKALGALLGLAVGESLGGAPMGAGSQMAFRLADSIIAQGGFDPDDVLRSYVSWFGTNPSGVDAATAEVLRRVAAGSDSFRATSAIGGLPGLGDADGGGILTLTRATPIAIAFAQHPESLRDATVSDSALTDFDPLVGKCALLHNQSLGLLISRGPRAFTDSLTDPLPVDDRIQDAVLPAIGGVRKVAEQLAASEPRVVTTPLAVSFAAYFTFDSFEHGLEWSVNLGGDSAAYGAVAGALLGARFGATHVPAAWVEQLDARAQVERLGTGLVALAG